MLRPAALALVATATSVLTQNIVFVNASLATGADDGSSWSSAYRGPLALKRAMDNTPALSNSQVWVAQGRYTPAPPAGDRRAAFVMKSGVAVYGGFASGETSLAQRDPAAHPVTLSADLNGDDDGTSHTDENAIHLVRAMDADSTAILDGVIITAGYAAGLVAGVAITDAYGANILIEGGSPAFANCTSSGGRASRGGGALIKAGASPTFIDCAFTGNTGDGGGVHNGGGCTARFVRCRFTQNTGSVGGGLLSGPWVPPFLPSSATLEDCDFIANGGSGAGALNLSHATFTRCRFRDNKTVTGGGGLLCWNDSTTTVIACTFIGNEGTSDGGDALRAEGAGVHLAVADSLIYAHGGPGSHASGATLYFADAAVELTNCTIANNNVRGSSFGVGAILGSGADSRLLIDNCIIWGNQGAGTGQTAAIDVTPDVPTTVNHSLIQGWTGSLPGVGSSGLNPLFVNPSGPDGVAGTIDDDLRLSPGSPAIDASDNGPLLAALGPPPLTDITGAPRFIDDPFTADTGLGTPPIADRGAYEFQPACPADLTADGLVDFSDYLAFLNFFDASDARADFNHDGLIDFGDYLEFLNHYDAGC